MGLKLSKKEFQKLGLRQATASKNVKSDNPEELPIRMVWETSCLLPEHKRKLVQHYYREMIRAWFN